MILANCSEVRTEHTEAVRRAIASMRESLAQPVHLADHAAAGMYSRFHFHRVFRDITGATPARYLAALRMHRAKELLAFSDHTVTSISSMVGYESLGTFTTQFGRLVGVTPGRLRRLIDWCGSITTLADLHDGNDDRITFVGLFRDGLPIGCPRAFGLLTETDDNLINGILRPTNPFAAHVMSVPCEGLLMELAVDRLPDVMVGTVAPVAAVEADRAQPQLRTRLRPRTTLDLPIVSVEAIQLINRRMTGTG